MGSTPSVSKTFVDGDAMYARSVSSPTRRLLVNWYTNAKLSKSWDSRNWR
jgi:hypothetical protein